VSKTHASTTYSDPLRVVVCGASVFLSAVADSLRPLSEVQVFHLSLRFPTTVAYVVDMAPDIVIIDRDNDDQGLVRALLNHGLPLVEVAANENTVTLLNGRRVPISEIGDMVRLISESKLVNEGGVR